MTWKLQAVLHVPRGVMIWIHFDVPIDDMEFCFIYRKSNVGPVKLCRGHITWTWLETELPFPSS